MIINVNALKEFKDNNFEEEISFDEVLVTIGRLIEMIFQYAVQRREHFSLQKTIKSAQES